MARGVLLSSRLVGFLIYASSDNHFDIDDRTLAHVRLVVMNKLRRDEPFMMAVRPTSLGDRWLWISPAVSINFHFHGSRTPAINRDWVEELMRGANGSYGMVITPEPDVPSRP